LNPLLNYTELNQTLEGQVGKIFPRWSALSKLSSVKESTSAIMVAGNSLLENQIGVANGFPKINLKRGEIIMMKDVLDVLGVKEGDYIEATYEVL
jgi:hypothetical protein